MKIGVIVRGEDRGLGIQTWEAWRHLDPAETLLVEMGELARGFECHADRYPGAYRVSFDGHRFDNIGTVKNFLKRVDVVYTAETVYDWRLCEWARHLGTAVVIQTNPELHRTVRERDGHEPTMWWNPTDWHMDLLRQPAWTEAPVEEVPMPVAVERFPMTITATPRPIRVLFVIGHAAINDRNGASIIQRTLRRLDPDLSTWRIQGQDDHIFKIPDGVQTYVEVNGPVEHYPDLYADADVLVMPRRYGGLCLPVQEACASGLAIVMSDCSPNERWPIIPILTERPTKLNRRGIQMRHPNFVDLVMTIERLAAAPGEVDAAKLAAVEWARDNSWEALLPTWRRVLAEAVALA